MSYRNGKMRQRGITLLLTLIALVVLAVVMVEFQSNAVVTARTDQFRVEQLQCRYAAESGIVIATAMIKASRQQRFDRPAEEPETPEVPEGPGDGREQPVDPNMLDPNSPLDPNALAANLPELEPEEPPEPRPDFVIAYQTVEVGPATVTIEIHDENAKWPLYWLLRSPFDSGSRTPGAESAFNQYVSRLGISRRAAGEVMDRTEELGDGIELPPPPMRILGNAQGRLSVRGRRVEFADRVTELEERHKGMVRFASMWQDRLLLNPEDEDLNEELATLPGRFVEYLSPWGVANINLNTAAAELIEAAYSPIGLTREQAEAIVAYREQTPLRSVNQLHQVGGLDVQLVNRLSSVTVVTSDTYSVHVEARVGRIVNRLVGGIFQDLDWNIRVAGVFPGG